MSTLAKWSVAAAAVVVIVVAGVVGFPTLRAWYEDVVLDNKSHHLSCEQLPPTDQVSRLVEQQRATVERIENIDSPNVRVNVDTRSCPGRANLVIKYTSHQQREQIESIMHGSPLSSIPSNWRNR